MDRIFSVPLKGGATTDVYLSEDKGELGEYLSSFDNALFVADRNTERFLPPDAAAVVLPPGEKEKNWHSVDLILSKALSRGMARDSVFVAVGGGILAKQLLDEYRRNNERKSELEERNAERQAELELKREERKRDELSERAKRDRERSEMEGRIAAQMERSNNISEGLQAAMESLRTSTEALHDEIRESREHSHDMANKVDHIYDRVDLIYEKEN